MSSFPASEAFQQPRRIVFGVDSSPYAEYAFRWSCENLLRPGDEVFLVHALPQAVVASATMQVDPTASNPEASRVLKKFHSLCESKGFKCTHSVLPGQPGELLVSQAEKIKADIVIVGCRGMGNLKRALMGSVSTYAVHHSNVPVIVVRSQYIPNQSKL